MNTRKMRTREKITVEQFLDNTKDKMCCVESPDIDVISVNMRGCKVSSNYGSLNFTNILDTFEIEETEINGIYVEDDLYYLEFGDAFSITISIMPDEIVNELIKNLKQLLSNI